MKRKVKDFDPRKEMIHEIIFEADTPAGRYFDILLFIFIIASVVVVMLESISYLSDAYSHVFYTLEWIFTIFFSIEYALRLYCVYRPMKYATSFFGIIDLLAILPTYLSLILPGTQYLLVIRALRLLRVFRIFKMAHFVDEGSLIMNALKASRQKILVFLYFIILMVVIIGSIMYLVEGNSNGGFDSIPRSIYWAIVTLTTVGYGDITPTTELGQFLSALVMILGYSVIAVPTGIVTSEFTKSNMVQDHPVSTQACRYCGQDGHDSDATYCKFCGEILNEPKDD